MNALRVALVASLVATGLAVPLFAVSTTATGVSSVQLATGTLQADANNTSQVTVGAQISGFMQEQTSQTDGAVESGMWSSAYENAGNGSEKTALVNERTEGLSAEVASLQAERRELIAARQAGNITVLEFRSRMNGLAGQYASLMLALEETEPRAEEVGADVTTIRDLRGAATEVVGPSVAASAGSGIRSPSVLSNNTTTVGPPVKIPGQNETETGLVGDRPLDEPGGNGTVGDGNGNRTIGIGDDNGTDGDESGDDVVLDSGNENDDGVWDDRSSDLPNPLADAF